MALNYRAAQFTVGLGLIDKRFERMLLDDRGQALRQAAEAVEAPDGVALTNEDRFFLGSIRASTLQEYAEGVERLCGPLRPLRTPHPAAAGAVLDEGSVVVAAVAAATR